MGFVDTMGLSSGSTVSYHPTLDNFLIFHGFSSNFKTTPFSSQSSSWALLSDVNHCEKCLAKEIFILTLIITEVP